MNSANEEDRWAYTETTTATMAAKNRSDTKKTIVRFDPSKPYAEQYTPLLVDDHAPTPQDIKKYRKKGEDHGDVITRMEKEEASRLAGKDRGKNKADVEIGKYLDIDHVTVSDETAIEITYVLPGLKGAKSGGLRMDRFEVIIRVDKTESLIAEAALRLHGSIRVKLIANLTAADATIAFGRVAPQHGTVPMLMVTDIDLSVLTLQGKGHKETRSSDFVPVTPYGDRFQSSIGPLRVLGF